MTEHEHKKHDDDRKADAERELMKAPHGRGERTAGDRELLEPQRAPQGKKK